MSPTMHIRLLGDFTVDYDGTPVTTINSSRLQSLLAYLVLHREAPQPRHHVAYVLWPDSSDAQALSNLRTLLHRLRDALPDAERFLHAGTHTLQWRSDAPCTLDVLDFEGHASPTGDPKGIREALERAMALYRGDLLPGCYDDWIAPHRERLRQVYLEALERLILLLETQRDYQKAIDHAQRLLRHDPLHEATYRRLMRLYALVGDRARAVRVYHTCATVMGRELDVEPSPPTREAYERLVQSHATARPATDTLVSASPLVGRDDEWSRMRTTWRAAAMGAPHLLLLSGEAGVGKTRLAEELLEWAGRQRIAAASARCYAPADELAYTPVAVWLRDRPLPALADIWLTEIARLLPELLIQQPHLPHPDPLTERWQRQRLFEALALALLGQAGPQLLLIDDLQWCDRDTLEWLPYLLRYDPQARLLVIGTIRPEEAADVQPLVSLLSSMRQEGLMTELELGRLGKADTTALAKRMVGRELDPAEAAYVYRESEGNPLFVVEMMRTGLSALEREVSAPLPTRVQAMIQARLAQLSPRARTLVNLAATIGREFTLEVLAAASNLDEDALVGALDELWRRRIVREQGAEGYDFSHGKLREVVYAGVSAARRRMLHRRVAQALEAVHAQNLDGVSAQLATHFERAGLAERAVPYYRRAAEIAAGIYANADAVIYLRRGLRLLDGLMADAPPDASRQELAARLRERLGDLLYRVGQHDEARTAYRIALTHVPTLNPIWQARLYRQQANTLREEHRYQDALRTYDRAEATLGPEETQAEGERRREWVQIQLERMWVHYWLDQWSEIARLTEQARPVVEAYGTPSQNVNFILSLESISLRRNRYVVSEETLASIEEALKISQESGNPGELAWVKFLLGFAYLWYGDLDQAAELMLAALDTAEHRGDVVHQSRCLTYLTILHRKRGQVDQVRDLAARSRAVAVTAHMPEYVGTARANQAWVAWREGDLSQARVQGRAALELWGQLPPGHASCCFQWTALWPLIGATLTEDPGSEAVAGALGYGRALLEPPQQRLPALLTEAVEQALQAWQGDQPEAARTRLERVFGLAREVGYL
jgi:DNA-binding SARP family transcriptional activator